MAKEKTPKPLEQFVEERAEAKFEEHKVFTRRIRVLQAALKAEEEKVAAARADAAETEKALSLYDREYGDRPEWLLPPKDPKPGRATLLGVLSDIHTGEVVRPAEMADYNKFDLRICEVRLERFFQRAIEMADSWSGYRYDGAVLGMPGDKISGRIHDELRQTDELSPYESVLWLVPRISAGVDLWLKRFKRVHCPASPGNHGRDDPKPRYKGRAAHNLDTLIVRLVAQQFKGREGVTFDVPDSIDTTFDIYDWRFSMEHGEEFQKTFSGSPEIGSLGPVKRGTMRKLTQSHAEGKPFKYLLVGHFHQYVSAASQGFVMNGSVKGFDEYARGRKFKPEPPQQALMAVTPENGIVTQAPVILLDSRYGDRKAEQW